MLQDGGERVIFIWEEKRDWCVRPCQALSSSLVSLLPLGWIYTSRDGEPRDTGQEQSLCQRHRDPSLAAPNK